MDLPVCLDHLSKSYLGYLSSSSWKEFKNSALFCMTPAIQGIRKSGDKTFPPPMSKDKVTLILCNHQSDLDQFIVFTATTFRDNAIVPVQLTGFTHQAFNTLPMVGQMVGKNLIGLDKGETKASIQRKILDFRHKGFNTFLLFPEGTFLHQESWKKSVDFQQKLGLKKEQCFQKLLYPKFGAYDAFVDLLEDEIEYVIDLTLDYPDYNPVTSEWSYLTYPSVAYSFLNKQPPPFLHASTTVVQGKRGILTHDFLLHLWRKKDQRLQVREKRELEAQYHYLFK